LTPSRAGSQKFCCPIAFSISVSIDPARTRRRHDDQAHVILHAHDQLVNYRVRGNHMIVDRLFAAAELRLRGKQQKIVRIVRTDGRLKS
jgi:type IV secretory pathway VirB9-like protein